MPASPPGSSLEAVTTCELCKEKLHLNLEGFDVHELYRAHANEQVSIFYHYLVSVGLVLGGLPSLEKAGASPFRKDRYAYKVTLTWNRFFSSMFRLPLPSCYAS